MILCTELCVLYPSNAVLSGILFLQAVFLQSLCHGEVGRIGGGEQNGLIRDVGLQTVCVDPQCSSWVKQKQRGKRKKRFPKLSPSNGRMVSFIGVTASHTIIQNAKCL